MTRVGICSAHGRCCCGCTPHNDGVTIEWRRDDQGDPCAGCPQNLSRPRLQEVETPLF